MGSAVKQAVKHDYERIPYLVAFPKTIPVSGTSMEGFAADHLESYLLKPKDKPSTPSWCSCIRSVAVRTCR